MWRNMLNGFLMRKLEMYVYVWKPRSYNIFKGCQTKTKTQETIKGKSLPFYCTKIYGTKSVSVTVLCKNEFHLIALTA